MPAFAMNCAGADLAVNPVSQAPDAVQSIDIYRGQDRLESKSIPPLRAGQSLWHLSSADSQRCNMANDSFTLTL
jgi:hypothetical protein